MTTIRPPVRVTRPAFSPRRPSPAITRPAAAAHAGQQMDYSNLLFERNRTMLGVEEIAAKLECTSRHVVDLIEAGELGSIHIGNGRQRKTYRVPAAEWERFLKLRASM